MEMKTYHAISRALEKEGLKDKKSPLNLSPELQDEIGTAFSLFKTDEDITGRLKDRVQPEILEALLKHISFDKFVQISLKALRRIVPLMEQGKRYDEACAEIYGDHYGKKNTEESLPTKSATPSSCAPYLKPEKSLTPLCAVTAPLHVSILKRQGK